MKQGISQIIGPAKYINGTKAVVYCALRPLLCAACGGEIMVGELFTRHQLHARGLRLMPRCQKCAPLTLPTGSDQQSRLLSTLLTRLNEPLLAEQEHGGGKSEHGSAQAQRQKVVQEVRRRLGPALARCRHSRWRRKG